MSTKVIGIRLTDEEIHRLDECAKQERRTRASMAQKIILDYVCAQVLLAEHNKPQAQAL
ncbi:hypothetical protein FACS1894216_16390 [Synergistales bacterium]|nr:hypothetical protein FACS1894216_16390 [Synergistales bacterium]